MLHIKKWISLTIVLLMVSSLIFSIVKAQDGYDSSDEIEADAALAGLGGEPAGTAVPNLAPSARSAILLDQSSGTVLFAKDEHEKLPPASITKVMTMLLTMEAIDAGKLQLNDLVPTSEHAASMGGSQIFLEPGEQMTVDDMLKGIALASGNDAAVALAEKVAGTEAQFVAMMNQRAQELGMNDTNFMNPNGLPVDNHYSSAHDIALMSRELLKHEEITKYTGMYQDYLRKDSAKPFWLVNTNKLVRFYDGADGLKTGYTSEAKYCLAATAKKEGLRVVVVVLGEPNTKTRNAEVSQMFDYAFAQYDNYKIFASGDEMGTAVVEKGTTREITLPAKHDYSVVVKKGTDQSKLWHELELSDLVAPIGVNQPIGKLRVFNGQEQIAEFTIDSPQSVTKASWWTLFKRSWGALMQ